MKFKLWVNFKMLSQAAKELLQKEENELKAGRNTMSSLQARGSYIDECSNT